jgi:hypothetical protein
MGSPEALAVVTMHVLVRPPQLGKAAGELKVAAAGQVCRGRVWQPHSGVLICHCLCLWFDQQAVVFCPACWTSSNQEPGFFVVRCHTAR